MTPFTQEVIRIIKHIPRGKVMTYGQIAGEAGSPRGARQVVRILHSMSEKYDLPWHRVMNAKGELPNIAGMKPFRQKSLLEAEGIEVSEDFKIDLSKYRY
jgi:methylated-DNA-protein-cysteine methyltransferase-like protein